MQLRFDATEEFWVQRKIDWEQKYFTPEHYHRQQLMEVLNKLEFSSALEIGCGAGANLWNIREKFNCIVGGIDINKDAIDFAKKKFPAFQRFFFPGTAEKINWMNKTWDLILTDACLIYVPPNKIENAIEELLRVARKYIVMVEWHGEDNFDGHWVYNYSKLFKNQNVKFYKIKEWIGGWEKYGQIIVVEVKN